MTTPPIGRFIRLPLAHLGRDGAIRVRVATGFVERARGLLGTRSLATDEALLISPCASVHTAAMGYPIDVIFLDGTATVMRVAAALAPWRAAVQSGARGVLEMATGVAAATGIAAGVRLTPLQPFLCGPWTVRFIARGVVLRNLFNR